MTAFPRSRVLATVSFVLLAAFAFASGPDGAIPDGIDATDGVYVDEAGRYAVEWVNETDLPVELFTVSDDEYFDGENANESVVDWDEEWIYSHFTVLPGQRATVRATYDEAYWFAVSQTSYWGEEDASLNFPAEALGFSGAAYFPFTWELISDGESFPYVIYMTDDSAYPRYSVAEFANEYGSTVRLYARYLDADTGETSEDFRDLEPGSTWTVSVRDGSRSLWWGAYAEDEGESFSYWGRETKPGHDEPVDSFLRRIATEVTLPEDQAFKYDPFYITIE